MYMLTTMKPAAVITMLCPENFCLEGEVKYMLTTGYNINWLKLCLNGLTWLIKKTNQVNNFAYVAKHRASATTKTHNLISQTIITTILTARCPPLCMRASLKFNLVFCWVTLYLFLFSSINVLICIFTSFMMS